MESKRGRVALALMTLVLLLVLAFGPVAPGVAYRMAEPQAGALAALPEPSFNPVGGGGSGGGG